MKDGDVLITPLQQADGTVKDRPVVLLRRMPPFDDFLVCGVTTQLQQSAPALDELISPADPDFRTSGLKTTSLIRLGYLAVLPATNFKGRIGAISAARRKRLLKKLSDFLQPQ